MSKFQTLQNKIGEVTFRKQLALQFLGKKITYQQESSKEEFEMLIKNRINNYKRYFKKLKEKKVLAKPFLDIGAGVGQAAMLLGNTFKLQGYALDISYETLQLADQFRKKLHFKKMPTRICGDFYHLPFADNSIPFIFCFQTLHHIPDPQPLLYEIHRVLTPGGYFYFHEEPIAQKVNINLWRRGTHLRWFEKLLKATCVLHFVSKIGKIEVEHNILEETFTIETWQKALSIFESVEANIFLFPFNKSVKKEKTENKNWLKPSFFFYFVLQLLGGGLEALCQKKSDNKKRVEKNASCEFICPFCHTNQPLAREKSNSLYCKTCNKNYKQKNDIMIFLPDALMQKLYL